MISLQMLPFMLVMLVAMDNGLFISTGVQICAWLMFVGGFMLEIVKHIGKDK